MPEHYFTCDHFGSRLLAASAALLLAACASPAVNQPVLGDGPIPALTLLDASPLAAGAEPEDLSQVDIIELTPEMEAFVDRYIEPHHGTATRLRRLLLAVMGEGTFELVYEERTRTAEETFETQRGNCLSFTNLFVAMARYAGLPAHYQEVEIPPLWSLAGESFLVSQHVNVHVDLGNKSRVVDFNINDLTGDFDARIISDRRARAHYFNNMGAEDMLAGETLRAFANFRQGIREDSTFSSSWVNLGNLYRRDGYPEFAEAAYMQALRGDESNLVAMSNLANLYRDNGRHQLADEYLKRVKAHRNRNPYYHFHLATESFTGGDYGGAIRHVKHAIRLRDDDSRFYSLLSISYLMSGNRSQARRWMEKAEAVAVERSDKERYNDKLEVLMSHHRGS